MREETGEGCRSTKRRACFIAAAPDADAAGEQGQTASDIAVRRTSVRRARRCTAIQAPVQEQQSCSPPAASSPAHFPFFTMAWMRPWSHSCTRLAIISVPASSRSKPYHPLDLSEMAGEIGDQPQKRPDGHRSDRKLNGTPRPKQPINKQLFHAVVAAAVLLRSKGKARGKHRARRRRSTDEGQADDVRAEVRSAVRLMMIALSI